MYIIKKVTFNSILGFAGILLMLMSSCSIHDGKIFGRYGKIAPDGVATQSFESCSVDGNLDYYASGPDLYPNAIIGIDRRYELVSDLWKKREFTPDDLKILVQNMQSKAWEHGSMMRGFNILDDMGNDIGDAYSILSVIMPVKMIDGNKVIVYTPPLDPYEKFKLRRLDTD